MVRRPAARMRCRALTCAAYRLSPTDTIQEAPTASVMMMRCRTSAHSQSLKPTVCFGLSLALKPDCQKSTAYSAKISRHPLPIRNRLVRFRLDRRPRVGYTFFSHELYPRGERPGVIRFGPGPRTYTPASGGCQGRIRIPGEKNPRLASRPTGDEETALKIRGTRPASPARTEGRPEAALQAARSAVRAGGRAPCSCP